MTDANIIKEIKEKLSPEIPVLRTPKTVQVLMIRQTHDYTVLRTEDTREINVAVTPTSISDPKQRARVVFMATKQKATESREFASLVKDLYGRYKLRLEEGDAILNCELKDRLCRACPRCTLFGAVVTEQTSKIWKKRWNIKHRIEYSSAFSLEPYEMISENITFNAVTESTQLTEQALGTTENVSPLANFPSIVSLNSPTWEELVMVIKNVLRCKSYGAEGRTKGDTTNYITGIIFANEEVLTPLEYVLELSESNSLSDGIGVTHEIAKKYGDMCTFPDTLRILSPSELETFVDHVQNFRLDDNFVKKLFNDSIKFGKQIENLAE